MSHKSIFFFFVSFGMICAQEEAEDESKSVQDSHSLEAEFKLKSEAYGIAVQKKMLEIARDEKLDGAEKLNSLYSWGKSNEQLVMEINHLAATLDEVLPLPAKQPAPRDFDTNTPGGALANSLRRLFVQLRAGEITQEEFDQKRVSVIHNDYERSENGDAGSPVKADSNDFPVEQLPVEEALFILSKDELASVYHQHARKLAVSGHVEVLEQFQDSHISINQMRLLLEDVEQKKNQE